MANIYSGSGSHLYLLCRAAGVEVHACATEIELAELLARRQVRGAMLSDAEARAHLRRLREALDTAEAARDWDPAEVAP